MSSPETSTLLRQTPHSDKFNPRSTLPFNLRIDVRIDDFRRNERSDLGTRTSTLDAAGIARLRTNWIYLDQEPATRKAASRGNASRARSK